MPLLAQCSSTRKQTFLVSDRYRDVAQHNSYILLANSYGLVGREIGATDVTPAFIVPLSGDITRVVVSGDYVFAMAAGRGLHILKYAAGATIPSPMAFIAIADLAAVQVQGERVFTYAPGKLTYYRFVPGGLQGQADTILVPLQTLEIETTQFFADQDLLITRMTDATVRLYTIGSASLDLLRNLEINGSSVFYGLYQANGRIVVDALDGITWLNLSPAGVITRSGSLYSNRDGAIVLGSLAKGDHLFLRFTDHIEVSRIGDGARVPIGRIPQQFSDIGNVAIVASDHYLHLLNQAPQRRDWSLATYSITSTVQSRLRLEAFFEELSAGASTLAHPDRLYLASNRGIYQADVDNQTSFRDQEPLVTVDGNIEDMVGSDSLLFVTAPAPGTGFTRIYVFTVEADGSFRELGRQQVSGSVSQLSQYGNTLSFLRHLRKTNEDLYEINVLYRTTSGFQLASHAETVPLGSANPFQSLQISDLGLVYLRDNKIWVQPTTLGQTRALTLPRPYKIEEMIALRGHFWIQAEIGLFLYKAEGDILHEVGYYPHWRGLKRLSNNLILAQNVLRKDPGSFHMLALEEGDLVNDRVDFSTTDDPLFIADMGDDIIVGERASLNIYQFECPTQSNVYLMPYQPDLELELNTTLDASEVVTMVIYNNSGDVIGYQDLEPDLIELFNGRKLSGWLFDYNNLETPATFLLIASRPMSPVLSGLATNSLRSRFAYRVPPFDGQDLFLPHFPKDPSWTTKLVLRTYNSGGNATAQVLDPANRTVSIASFRTNSTLTQTVPSSSTAPWLRIHSPSSGGLAGFALFQDGTGHRAAAVPLSTHASNYLVLPYLSKPDRTGNWTGMVLANIQSSETFVRVISYNRHGQIQRDRVEILPPQSTLVVNAELWLAGLDSADDSRWLVVVADQPILGMALYGNTRDASLAGLELSGSTGESLLIAGIRSQNNWVTELRITNMDGIQATVTATALDGAGKSLGQVQLSIGPSQNVGKDVAALFASLGATEVRRIQNVRISSTNPLSVFAFRTDTQNQSIEAYSALVE